MVCPASQTYDNNWGCGCARKVCRVAVPTKEYTCFWEWTPATACWEVYFCVSGGELCRGVAG